MPCHEGLDNGTEKVGLEVEKLKNLVGGLSRRVVQIGVGH